MTHYLKKSARVFAENGEISLNLAENDMRSIFFKMADTMNYAIKLDRILNIFLSYLR